MSASGLGALGFDGWSLLFQVVNFAIILVVLRLVAYKPILKVLENRRVKIEESLKASTEMEAIKKKLVEEKNQLIKQAQTEVHQLLQDSRQQAEHIMQASQAKAEQQTKHIIDKARTQASQELRSLQDTFKKEAVTLVVLATEKIISEKLDAAADEAFITKALDLAEKQLPHS